MSYFGLRTALLWSAVLCVWLLWAGEARATIASPEWVGVYEVQGQAGLLWIKSPELASYKILRRKQDETTFVLIGKADTNHFTDTAITPDTVYLYRLVGVSPGGEESLPSVEFQFSVRSKVKTPLGAPQWDGQILLEGGIGLKWQAMDRSRVIAFNIYRSNPPDERLELLASTKENQFVDFNVVAGEKYSYRITALDTEFKETPPSETAVVNMAKKPEREAAGVQEYLMTPRKTFLVKMAGKTVGKGVPLKNPTDLALLKNGRLAVADSGNGLIQVFSHDGEYLYSFSVPTGDPKAKANPLGLTVDKDGRIWCTDAYSGRLMMFNQEGSLLKVVQIPRQEPAEVFGLLDVCVADDGQAYVVDNANRRVDVIGADFKFVRAFGTPGQDPGEFTAPGFCMFDGQGRIFIGDALLARLQLFSLDGQFVKAFGRYSKNVGSFGRPKGMAIDKQGRIYVADSLFCQIQVFDESGKYLFTLADEKNKPLDLGSPNGIALDDEDNIYIAERLSNRVQIRHVPN